MAFHKWLLETFFWWCVSLLALTFHFAKGNWPRGLNFLWIASERGHIDHWSNGGPAVSFQAWLLMTISRLHFFKLARGANIFQINLKCWKWPNWPSNGHLSSNWQTSWFFSSMAAWEFFFLRLCLSMPTKFQAAKWNCPQVAEFILKMTVFPWNRALFCQKNNDAETVLSGKCTAPQETEIIQVGFCWFVGSIDYDDFWSQHTRKYLLTAT